MAKDKAGMGLRDNSWWQLAFILTTGVIFLTPFFRGLFFTGDQMATLMIVAAAFFLTWMWKISQNERAFLKDPLDILMLIFGLSYLVSFFWYPASKNLAAVQAALGILFFMVYWTVSWLAYDRKQVNRLVQILYATAVAVALAGLGAVIGLLTYQDGFVWTRIYSVFQYPNTTAALLLGASFLGMHLYFKAGTRGRLLMAALNGLIFLVFFGTQSRGALLVLPVALLIYAVLVPAQQRFSVLVSYLFSIFAGWVFYDGFVRAGQAGSTGAATGYLLAVIALCLALEWAKGRAGRLGIANRFSQRSVTIVLSVVLVVAVAYMVLGFGVLDRVSQYLGTGQEVQVDASPDRGGRQALDLATDSAQSRLYWMRQSVDEIFLQRPLIGYGGGSWEASYKSFQDYPYQSTRIHNSWLEILVDTGLLGFVSFAGIWVMLLVYTVGVWRKSKDTDERSLQAALATAALAMGGHSLLDFNFSLAGFAIYMFALFGLIRAMRRNTTGAGYVFLLPKNMREIRNWLVAGVLVISVLAGGIGAMYHLSRARSRDAVRALQTNNTMEAVQQYERANRYWPFEEGVLFDLSLIHLNQQEVEQADMYLQKLLASNAYFTRAYANVVRVAWAQQDYDRAIGAGRTAVEKERWNVTLMEQQAETHFFTSIILIQEQGDTARAREVLEVVKELPGTIEEMNREVDEINDTTLLVMGRNHYIAPTPRLLIYAGASAYLFGETEQALSYLEAANEDPECPEDVYFWLALSYEEAGQMDEYARYYRLVQVSELMNPNFSPESYGFYRDLQL